VKDLLPRAMGNADARTDPEGQLRELRGQRHQPLAQRPGLCRPMAEGALRREGDQPQQGDLPPLRRTQRRGQREQPPRGLDIFHRDQDLIEGHRHLTVRS